MIHFFCVNLFLGRGGGQGLRQRQTETDYIQERGQDRKKGD